MTHQHTNLTIRNSGLIIKQKYPFLGVSPDGIFKCECHRKYPLEIKCPITMKYSKNLKIDLFIMNNPFVFQINNELQLFKNHEYYYQIQLQIFLESLVYLVYGNINFNEIKKLLL